MVDVLIDANNDLKIANGDFVTGESELQEVALILAINKGELKSDVLVGCNLVSKINTRASQVEVERVVRVQLERDGKNYDDIKQALNFDYGN